jgi:hypothetical protein
VVYFNKFVLCCVVALVQQVKERELDWHIVKGHEHRATVS